MNAAAEARDVRAEDAFDIGRVAAWLRTNADRAWSGAPTGESATPAGVLAVSGGVPYVTQFPGGASNLTYLLSYPDGRELILRRPPPGTKARGAHDMRREYDVQAALAPVFPKVAPMVAYCDDQSVIGSPFYVMERLDGTILRRDLPPELGLGMQRVGELCRNAVDTLVELHRVDPAACGLDRLDKGPGYVARQVGGWSARYRNARTGDVGDFEATMAWLDAHQPPDIAHVVIHNDFRFDNLVLAPEDPTRIVGVLDWELATVGDPLLDLASGLAYWVEAGDPQEFVAMRLVPTHEAGMWTRGEVVDYYCGATGVDLGPGQWRWYETFGAFRLAAIAQQIYHRYHHGQSRNPRYGQFRHVVRYLDRRCTDLITGASS